MDVSIEISNVTGEYKLYCVDLDTLLVSDQLSKLLVMFDKLLRDLGYKISILESDDITYTMDSSTMREMILSNVRLLKMLKNASNGFQSSKSKFGSSSSISSSNSSISNSKSNISRIINKPKGVRYE